MDKEGTAGGPEAAHGVGPCALAVGLLSRNQNLLAQHEATNHNTKRQVIDSDQEIKGRGASWRKHYIGKG